MKMLVHKHLIVRAEVNNPPVDVKATKKWLKKLVKRIGMKILKGPYGVYSEVVGNRGMTVACIIETSHLCLHTWDEDNPHMLQLDVYTCGPLDTQIVFDAIQVFNPSKIEYKYLDREHNLKEIPLE